MLKHIVMWRFLENAEGHTKEENLDIAKNILLALPPLIPQVKSMQVGKDVLGSDASYDMALVIEFDGIDELKQYTVHPEHQKVSAYITKVRESRVCCDFQMD